MNTTKLVEQIAKAVYERLNSRGPDWEAVPPLWREVWLEDARTTLEVAGPVIAEHALRSAIEELERLDDGRTGGYYSAGRHIIARLRDRAELIKRADTVLEDYS